MTGPIKYASEEERIFYEGFRSLDDPTVPPGVLRLTREQMWGAEDVLWELLNAVTERLNQIAAPGVYLSEAHAAGSKFITARRQL
jgi:hypothetical protein